MFDSDTMHSSKKISEDHQGLRIQNLLSQVYTECSVIFPWEAAIICIPNLSRSNEVD